MDKFEEYFEKAKDFADDAKEGMMDLFGEAMEKAKEEYLKFQNQNLSPVEEAYLQTIKAVEKTARKKSQKN